MYNIVSLVLRHVDSILSWTAISVGTESDVPSTKKLDASYVQNIDSFQKRTAHRPENVLDL
jgi:hypothetical protein